MWCVVCKVPFSWTTGKIVKGVVHNPHFYEWKRKGGLNIKTPEDVICGGLCDISKLWNAFENIVKSSIKNEQFIKYLEAICENAHRFTAHHFDIHTKPLRRKCQHEIDNEEIRLKLASKDINEKACKSVLFSREKKRESEVAILQLYEMLNTFMTEHLNAMVKLTDLDTLIVSINNIDKIRVLYNTELIKIGYTYSITINEINEHWKVDDNFRRKVLKNELKYKVHEINYINMYDEWQNGNLRIE